MKKNTPIVILAFIGLFLFSCKEDKPTIKSVFIFGNSIVDHGDAPTIGWHGRRGMASSVADSDFVHLLMAEIKKKDTAIRVRYSNMGNFELTYSDYNWARLDTFIAPDMLILRFGENVDDSTVGNGQLEARYDTLIRRIDPDEKAVVVIVSSFWERPNTNRIMKAYAAKHQYLYVHNDDLWKDSTNAAFGLFKDAGVAMHPSDKGMRMIKERIWEQIKSYF
jgi:hypothetical protein